MLSGAKAAGWGKQHGEDMKKTTDLAEQAMTLLSGYDATVTEWKLWHIDDCT